MLAMTRSERQKAFTEGLVPRSLADKDDGGKPHTGEGAAVPRGDSRRCSSPPPFPTRAGEAMSNEQRRDGL